MTIFGYARVSTDGQSVDAQVKQLRAAGAEKVFRETASGVKSDRRELARALKALGGGDTLLVTRLDRLARSTRDLLNTLDTVAKAGAGFRSLADTWADTTTPHGRLMLTVLGGLAEFERDLIPTALNNDLRPISACDRGDAVVIVGEEHPSLAGCVDDFVVSLEDRVRELVAA